MSNMDNEFNKFDDIKHKPLRVFNRAVLSCNLRESLGEGASESYLDLFTKAEKAEIYQILKYVKAWGVKRTRDVVTKDMEFTYNVGEA